MYKEHAQGSSLFFILKGVLSLHIAVVGKVGTLGPENTIGEDLIMDKRYKTRNETIYGESKLTELLEIDVMRFMILK